MSRVIACLLVVAWIGLSTAAAPRTIPPQEPPPPPARDLHGDVLPELASMRLGTVRWRDGNQADSVKFSPDGKVLVSGSSQGQIRIWDSTTGQRLRELSEQQGWRTDFAFGGADNSLAVILSGTLQLYDISTAKSIRKFADQQNAQSLAYSRDGKIVAAGSYDGSINLWDAVTTKSIRKIQGYKDNVTFLTFSPDSKQMAATSSSTIRLYDVAAGKMLHKLRRHPGGVTSVAYSADGAQLVSGGSDNSIRLWDVATGKMLRQFGYHATIPQENTYYWRWRYGGDGIHVAFAPDSKTVYSGSGGDRAIRAWDPATGKALRQFTGHTGGVNSISLSPDGQRLASASQDGTIRLWDTTTGKQVSSRDGHEGAAIGVGFASGTNRILSAGRDNTIRVWDRTTGKELHSFKDGDEIALAAFAPDGQTVALVRQDDDAIVLCEAATGKELHQLDGANNRLNRILFSPDGAMLLAVSYDNLFSLWETKSGKKLRDFGTSSSFGINNMYATPVSFTPDGKELVTRGWNQNNNTIAFWDVATGKEKRNFIWSEQTYPLSVAISPDGKKVAALDYNHAILLCNAADGKLLHRFQPDQQRGWYRQNFLPTLLFSPDGKKLASVSWAESMHVWEVATGKEIRQLKGHAGPVTTAAFSADGKSLVSASSDTTVLVWELDAPTVEERKQAAAGLTPQAIDALWKDLELSDAAKGQRALRILIAAPQQALALLRERLKPAVPVDPQRLATLLANLDSNKFEVRNKATIELEKLEDLAETGLRDLAAAKVSPECRQRAQTLIQKLEGPTLSPPRLRSLRAIGVLERIGTTESRQVLAKLAEGEAAALCTKEAKGALHRLSLHSPAVRGPADSALKPNGTK
jgi:WD40 repeat protein